MRASASLFSTLGTNAFLGRVLIPEDEAGSGRPVVLLTHALWTRRFGANPDIVGTTIVLNGEQHVVVGVLPASYITPVREVEVIAPFPIDADPRRNARDSGFLRLIGRLRPGVTTDEAARDLDAIMARLRAQYPVTNATHAGVRITEWHSALVGRTKLLLVMLQTAVALVMAVACANLANLFLASALRREQEFAVRAALGASRGRLVRDVIAESAVLAALGSAGGILLGMSARTMLVSLAPADLLRASGGAGLDWHVIVFATAVTCVATLTLAALPCWRILSGTLGTHLRTGARTEGSAHARGARRALVAIEVALAFALVTTAVLLTQSFARLQAVDPGFRVDHLLTVRLSLPRSHYRDRAAAVLFAESLRPRLRTVPGVLDAAAVNVVPLNGYRATADVWPASRPEPAPEQRVEAHYRMVGPGYFATFGVAAVEGRATTDRDRDDSEPVVLVNRALARRFWNGRSPVGEYLVLRDDRDETVRRARIIGVAADVKHFGLDTESTPDVYVPIAQVPEGTIGWLMNNMYWGVRTSVEPDALREAVRREIRGVDPNVPASAMRTMEEALALASEPRRLNLYLVRVFGLAALALAAAGIYSVTAFSVSARTRELGIRAALGASPSANVRVLLEDAGKPLLLGLVLGGAISVAAAPAVRSILFGVTLASPGSMAAVGSLILTVGFAAALTAAARVGSVDPITALRSE
jgi:predicted permease